MATFSIHVSHNFSDGELRDLVEWIGTLPKMKCGTLKLESVKRTNSMLLIFESIVIQPHCRNPGDQLDM